MRPITILIPAYNEERILQSSIEKVHLFLDEHGVQHEIIVTSNGSTDRTVEIGNFLAERYSWLRFYSVEKRSVGEAFRCGVTHSMNEFLITLDADLSSELTFILDAAGLLEQSSMVVGCKTLGQQRRSVVRILGSQIYLIWTQLVFGLSLLDYSLGSKAYRRSSILPILKFLTPWTGYPLEISLYLHLNGKRIVQIGVNCDDKRKSHFNLLHEGFYRYWHLLYCWRNLRRKKSWFHLPIHDVPEIYSEAKARRVA